MVAIDTEKTKEPEVIQPEELPKPTPPVVIEKPKSSLHARSRQIEKYIVVPRSQLQSEVKSKITDKVVVDKSKSPTPSCSNNGNENDSLNESKTKEDQDDQRLSGTIPKGKVTGGSGIEETAKETSQSNTESKVSIVIHISQLVICEILYTKKFKY